tara:strand:+ start:408 stop:1277 length:870 start_codon:yes stop_codon:yes gene_type:complete
MKHFHVCCDGSFGNRYSGLVGGITLARLCDLPVTVSWPSTQACRARFYELFSQDNDLEASDTNIREYYSIGEQYNLLSCDASYLQFFRTPGRVEPAGLNVESFRNFVNSSDKPVFYYTPLLYDWIPEEEIKKTIRELRFGDEILANVSDFLDENELRQGYYGIHLRMTDFVNIESFDVDHWIRTVAGASDRKFFVCSDDPDTEARFNDLPNAFSYPKKYKTEKYIAEGDWHHPFTDMDGRHSVFNVERGTEHVKEAVVDFILLSLSNPFDTGKQSTFLKMAKRAGTALR